MTVNYDYLIIGAGISGAAVGYELAQFGKVAIVEAESSPGYHSTGRSAALYTPNYGPDLVRTICRLGWPFLSQPPNGFAQQSVLSPRGLLMLMPTGAEAQMQQLLETNRGDFKSLTREQVLNTVPFLHSNSISGAVYERGVMDMDVDVLYQGYLRGFKQRGGTLLTKCRIESISRNATQWHLATANAEFQSRVIVNAAGAWADEVAGLANVEPIGLQPKRRTAILLDTPNGLNSAAIPAMIFYGTENYIKPQAGQLMVSPGDETPVVAQDIQPDEIDIAMLVDWLEKATSLSVKKIKHRWAGLRNFVDDGLPVVGFDAAAENFFWLAAQGGYGIMMSGPLGRAGASLITSNCLPKDFIDAGISKQDLSAQRLKTT